MITAMSAAASGMEAQLSEIENISNNLANVNTPAFKRTRAEFQDLLYETLKDPGANSGTLSAPLGLQRGMGVNLVGTGRDFGLGPAQSTHRNLDVMIKGNGFFPVRLPSNEIAYRRDGTFFKAVTGRIETIDGYPLQPEMYVPTTAARIDISEDGVVVAVMGESQKQTLGQIQLAVFTNQDGLKAVGRNLYTATDSSGPPMLAIPGQNTSGALLQRFLEGSNVNVVTEMTDMISAQRAYEMNSKVVQTVDQMLQHAVNIR